MSADPIPPVDLRIIQSRKITPMDAVHALYAEGEIELTQAIVSSLSAQVFSGEPPKPASWLRRRLAQGLFKLLKRTTRTETSPQGITVYRNRLLEGSHHPYAMTLIGPSDSHSKTFVEGGDPMNAPYMMISPDIRAHASRWDRILLNSMHGRDVQLRFICEARATYQAAKERLDRSEPVRLKASAAGTGLSLILVFDRLTRDGYDVSMIDATLADRDPSNVIKAERLLAKLPTTQNGIRACEEDLLAPGVGIRTSFDVVTLIGILEYFCGCTCATTEEHQGSAIEGDQSEATDLVKHVASSVANSGVLITNSYKTEPGGRIIEVFGKRLRYRSRENLHKLMATAGLKPMRNAGSGHVYDIEVYSK